MTYEDLLRASLPEEPDQVADVRVDILELHELHKAIRDVDIFFGNARYYSNIPDFIPFEPVPMSYHPMPDRPRDISFKEAFLKAFRENTGMPF